jgi:site-specific DNA-methyltransferase (adenine-specific)
MTTLVGWTCTQGDATKPLTLEGRAAVLLTDPPYCLLTRRRKRGDEHEPKGRKNESVRRFEDVREYRAFTKAWLENIAGHVDGPMIIWTNLLGQEPIRTEAAKLGWTESLGEYVWAKRTREASSGEELLRVVEVALVLARERPAPSTLESPALPWSVVAGYDDDGEAERWGSHPNHKPFGVIEPLVRTWSRPGQLVLDCFAGSGSIPAAAVKLGRNVHCLELDPVWAERVTQRLRSLDP